MKYNEIYIVDGLRTSIGSFCGQFGKESAVALAVPLVKALLERQKLAGPEIDEVIMGSVLTANQGQAPARQVVIKSGLPISVSALTINKVCSSGLMAILLSARNLYLGISNVAIAGGMESMSQVPHYLPNMRFGAKLGNQEVIDGIIKDGLWDVYNDYHMGCAGELCAKTYNFSREIQDQYALESYERAINAIELGQFKNEILPINIQNGKNTLLVEKDEEPFKLDKDKIGKLKPAFDANGTITPANASSLNDGVAVLMLASEASLKKYGLKPRAKILSEGFHSREPEWFTLAPVDAIKNAIKNSGFKQANFDLFEINEAFSSVALACTKELELDPKTVNIRGGAVALGHPIGASGARIVLSLMNALEQEGKKRGVAGICNGGGEATSIAIELV